MNIFYLSIDPYECACQHVDKHVIKMILEHTQIISTVLREKLGVLQESVSNSGRKVKRHVLEDAHLEALVYKQTHTHHPCVEWVRESHGNYLYLLNLTKELNEEYKFRFQHSQDHKSFATLIQYPVLESSLFPQQDMTTPRSCMDKSYIISNNPIVNYRNYYIHGKYHIAQWTQRKIPFWYYESYFQEHIWDPLPQVLPLTK